MPACPSCGHENPEGARFCNACASPLEAKPAAREQRKTVTVLFCDITGSTALGESTDPEALRAVLARYFERMKAILESHGASVEKFIGDAVMAVFGVPQVHEDDALRACRAAIEMRDALPELGLQARIGLNTGEVVTGTEERLATGDAVNVAARLEQAAPPGEILIGDETLALVRDAVETEEVEALELKGKAEAVPAYRLVAVTGELARRHTAPMVGREREQRLLEEAWSRVASERMCHLFTILGAAGVGKSRLAAEFLASRSDAIIVRGRCLPYGEGITYWPVVEVLKELPATAVEEAGTAPVLELLSDDAPDSSSEELAWSFRKLLEAVASTRPLVCVFDDIHWGEETFLDLVEHTADLSRDAPVLLLCMARPELFDRRAGWGGGKINATTVLLEPLPAEETERLIQELGAVDAGLRQRILDASEGNPFFVEEMVALVREHPDGDVSVPPTIQALLAARLDQLAQEERAVLQFGSVEGRMFHRGAVQALASADSQVPARLTGLVRKELLRPDRAILRGEDAFRFRHLLIRDAAYDALTKSERGELHERFAGWLEEHADGLEEKEEILGYHLEQACRYRLAMGADEADLAELGARAAERLSEAGHRAFRRSDLPAAVNLLDRAAALWPRDDGRGIRDLPLLGQALVDRGEWDRGRKILFEARDTARARGDDGVAAHANIALVFVRIHSEAGIKHEEVEPELQDAVSVFEASEDWSGLASALRVLGMLRFWRGRVEEAGERFDRALEYARRAGDRQLEDLIVSALAGTFPEGPIPVPEALERVEALDRPDSGASLRRAALLRERAELTAMEGEFELARGYAAESKEMLEQLGLETYLVGSFPRTAATIEWLAGDLAAVEHILGTACDALVRITDWGHFSSMAPMLANVLLAQGRPDEAEPLLEAALPRIIDDDIDAQILSRRAQALLLAVRGEPHEAERLASEAVELTARTDCLGQQGLALHDLAEVLTAAGRDEEAMEALERARSLFERKGNVVMEERMRARLAEVRT